MTRSLDTQQIENAEMIERGRSAILRRFSQPGSIITEERWSKPSL